MKLKRETLLIGFVSIALMYLLGCGGITSSSPSTSSGSSTPPAISVALSSPPTSVTAGQTAQFTATVSNDSSGKGVAWSCTPANSCGSFNPASGSGNTVTTTYTAPGAAPTGGSVMIIATSQADGKTTGTASVTIGSNSTSLSLQAGTYVFYVVGEDSAKRTLGIAGAATLDGNGNVTGGEQDYDNADGIAGNNTPEQANADAFQSGGTYTVGSDGRGTLAASVANTTEGASGKETFSITVVNSKHALITEFDGSATSNGSLDFQTPPPNGEASYSVQDIAGPYSFAVTGFSHLYAYSQGGVFTLCAGPAAPNSSCAAAGDVVNSVTDFNETNGSVTINTNLVKPNTTTGVENYPTAFAPGCATLFGTALPGCGQAPDKFGRGTANYGGIFWSYYVVGPEVMRLLGSDGDVDGRGTGSGALDNLYVGSAYGQGAKNAGTFTTASLNGSYVIKDGSVFPDSSLNATTPPNADTYFAAAGTLSAQNGAVSGFIDASSSSTTSFASAYNNGQALTNATFNVQSPTQGTGGNGILTLPAANTAGISVLGVYFVDPNLNILDPNNTTSGLGGALIANLDATNLGTGILIPQGTVSTPLQGNFAWLQQSFNASGEQDAVGQAVIATNNSLSGKADVNDLFNTKQTPAAALAGNLTADQSHPGRFTVTITTSLNGTQTTYTLVLYQIGSLGYVDVQTDANQVGAGTLQIQ